VRRKTSLSALACTVTLMGLGFIAAGASIPHEQTIAFGLFLVLSALALLLSLHWPKPQPNNLVQMADYRPKPH